MKKINILIIVLFFGVMNTSYAQDLDKIVKTLTNESKGTYLKDFKVVLKPYAEERFSVVISKNTKYEFSFYQKKTNQIKLELYKDLGKQEAENYVNTLGSQRNSPMKPSKIDTNNSIIRSEYIISKTGVYHLFIYNNTDKHIKTAVLLSFLNKEFTQPERNPDQPEFVDITDEIKKGKNYFFTVDVMPKFKDEQFTKFYAYINHKIIYPQEAIDKGIEGNVYVQFVIDKGGYIKDAKITKGIHPSIDQEALRIIYSSPKWSPGIKDGQAVDVVLTYPIEFKLPD